jgi:PAS domain-containing protein
MASVNGCSLIGDLPVMVRTKLVVGFVLIAIVVSTLGVMQITGLEMAEQTFLDHQEQSHQVETAFARLKDNGHMGIIFAHTYIHTGNTTYRDRARHHRQQMGDAAEELQQLDQVGADHQIIEANAAVDQAVRTAIMRYDDGADPESATAELNKISHPGSAVMQAYHGPVAEQFPDIEVMAHDEVRAAFTTAEQLMLGINFLSLLLASVFGILLARHVSLPIRELQRVIAAISRGNLDTTIDDELLERNDEIGGLAQAFDRTLTSLKLAMRRTAPELEEEIADREEDLGETYAMLESALDAAQDGLLIIDKEGNFVRYNDRLKEIWDLPAHLLEKGDSEAAIQYVKDQLVDPDAFEEKTESLLNNPEEESSDILEFKDGRVVERYSNPHRHDGKIIGRVWSFRDVTDEYRRDDDTENSNNDESKGRA